ncbi:MAG: MoxR family ATPase [Candidatus Babeliales bacterium]
MQNQALNNEFIEIIKTESARFALLKTEVAKVVVGNESIIDFIIMALLCNGHILLEGVPGVAKTTIIKAVTQALGLTFRRIQFTPDLLPADLIGTLIYNPKTQDFETKKGPIFANLILADEINRAPAKVQSALLEAMQEQQVTIGSQTFKLETPFFVLATQNPVEQEGTYPLPEAQIDRFMFKLLVGYLQPSQEREIISKSTHVATITQVLDRESLFQAQKVVEQIYVDPKIVDYIVALVFATRTPKMYNLAQLQSYIQYGVSPRATVALYKAAQAHAFLKKRNFVIPDDVKAVAGSIIRHRITLSYQAQVDGISTDTLVDTILKNVPSL